MCIVVFIRNVEYSQSVFPKDWNREEGKKEEKKK